MLAFFCGVFVGGFATACYIAYRQSLDGWGVSAYKR